MSNLRFSMTSDGFKKLEKELNHLKTVERPAVIKAIAEARAHGDLSENAEYHAAKEKQSFIEAKISDLEAKVSRAHIVNISEMKSDHIQFGATVIVVDEETDKKAEYRIVSDFEVDAANHRISITSPMAKAMLGKKAGDSFEVITPKGERYYQVVKIKYEE